MYVCKIFCFQLEMNSESGYHSVDLTLEPPRVLPRIFERKKTRVTSGLPGILGHNFQKNKIKKNRYFVSHPAYLIFTQVFHPCNEIKKKHLQILRELVEIPSEF